MPEIVDLRGRQAMPAAPPILADPSGRRARLLARTGRIIALVFLLWITGLALAGLGVLPAGFLPFAGGIGGQAAPPVIAPNTQSGAAEPQSTVAGGLSAATGSAVGRASAGSRGTSPGATAQPRSGAAGSGNGHRARTPSVPGAPASTGASPTHASAPVSAAPPSVAAPAPGATGAPGAAGAAAGASSNPGAASGSGHGTTTAPGQTVKPTTPGHSSASTAPGNSGAAPGQTQQGAGTVTSPGQSGSAPGQTVPHGSGHGNSN